jgi:hypothetical protein
MLYSVEQRTRWRSWLRHCAASRKVVGSISDGSLRISLTNPSDHTMAPGPTQPLTEMSTKNLPLGDKDGRYVRLTALPLSCSDCQEILRA